MGRPDAGEKGNTQDGGDSSLRKPDAENLSRNLTDQAMKEQKSEKTADKAKASDKNKDKADVTDKTNDKFLQLSSVQATLAQHVPAIGNVAKHDPNAASTYPQWADWHAEQNEKDGDKEAAEMMKQQGANARAAIEKEKSKGDEEKDKEPETETT